MSSDESGYNSSNSGWIQWFCDLKDNQFLCKVDEQYICDHLNLSGLKEMFPHYNLALEMILRPESPQSEEFENQKYLQIYYEAVDLYGLIHSRFILTAKGKLRMKQKFNKKKFGICPRVLCEKSAVLPVGMSPDLKISRVKVYCPRCQEIYFANSCSELDGAYFGCSFPNIMIITYPQIGELRDTQKFVPKVYGFKIYQKRGSKYYQNDAKQQINSYAAEQLWTSKNASFIRSIK